MPRSNVIILTDPDSKFSVNQGSATLLPIEGNYSRGKFDASKNQVLHCKSIRFI